MLQGTRFDITANTLKGLYAEASFRLGRSHFDYKTNDIEDDYGNKAKYKIGNNYYAGHLGLGYIIDINENAKLDLYTKYFINHQAGFDKTILDEPFHISGVTSQRIKAGARFSYMLNKYFTPYIGAAYEHEFSAKTRSSVHGYAIPGADLRGSTGIGELGVNISPCVDIPMRIDLGMQGLIGKQEGIGGTLMFNYEF